MVTSMVTSVRVCSWFCLSPQAENPPDTTEVPTGFHCSTTCTAHMFVVIKQGEISNTINGQPGSAKGDACFLQGT